MSQFFPEFPRDDVIEQIIAACARFTMAMPGVRLAAGTPLILRSYVDDEVLDEIREQRRHIVEVAFGTYDFLYKATITAIVALDRPPDPDVLFRLREGVFALALGEEELQTTRDRLWCTIWPFCRTKR